MTSNYIYGPQPPIDPPDDDEDRCPCGAPLNHDGDCPRCEARIEELQWTYY